ncbi:hypothetical protein HELRODRAFT_160613 [Helobdella robusta]|uniref:Uncharacterized protein n=1 Tax=Helobdella robusta TaxID=6412 RepID=T1EQH9_HELRO|nr:hypothetical protein HELRODRAFT_160613 [Helobdella robusta]ESO06443.1 hypothetical protein HELRODRAFT_160613 [Helobdella robusta]
MGIKSLGYTDSTDYLSDYRLENKDETCEKKEREDKVSEEIQHHTLHPRQPQHLQSKPQLHEKQKRPLLAATTAAAVTTTSISVTQHFEERLEDEQQHYREHEHPQQPRSNSTHRLATTPQNGKFLFPSHLS